MTNQVKKNISFSLNLFHEEKKLKKMVIFGFNVSFVIASALKKPSIHVNPQQQ